MSRELIVKPAVGCFAGVTRRSRRRRNKPLSERLEMLHFAPVGLKATLAERDEN